MALVPDNVELSVKNAKTRDDLLQLKYSPAAQSLLKVLPYVTTEAVLCDSPSSS